MGNKHNVSSIIFLRMPGFSFSANTIVSSWEQDHHSTEKSADTLAAHRSIYSSHPSVVRQTIAHAGYTSEVACARREVLMPLHAIAVLVHLAKRHTPLHFLYFFFSCTPATSLHCSNCDNTCSYVAFLACFRSLHDILPKICLCRLFSIASTLDTITWIRTLVIIDKPRKKVQQES